MAAEQPGIDRSESIEDLHHLRLMALLDEQVRDKGARKAAQDLGVDHRTLASSLESGKLSRRMRVALNRALLAGGGSPAQEQRERNDELAGRLEKVEGQVEELGAEMNRGLTALQGEVGQSGPSRSSPCGASREGWAGWKALVAHRDWVVPGMRSGVHRPGPGSGGTFPSW